MDPETIVDAQLYETNEIYATCCIFSVFIIGTATYMIIEYLT